MENSINAVETLDVLTELDGNKIAVGNMIYSVYRKDVFRYDAINGELTKMVDSKKVIDLQEIANSKYITWKAIGHSKKDDGHLQITVSTGSNCNVKIAVHRLAAMYVLGISSLDGTFGKGSEYVVDHINENKLDNRASNLQVLSRGDNTRKYYARKG